MMAGALTAAPVAAQNGERVVPGCAAAVCEEGTAIVAALDTLLRSESACADGPPFVLETMHLAPYTAFSDAITHQSPRHVGLPSSPAVMRVQDLYTPFRRYWNAVRIVSAAEVEQGAVPASSCLFVFSPVTWLGPDTVRIIVARTRETPRLEAQLFVFLERRRDGWRAMRVERGMQS